MELVNTIDSKELYANRAVNDKNGNPIDTTYMDSNKLTIEDGKITEYNGTPFAGQNDETDPVFSASAAASITNTDISNWNGKQSKLTAGSNITISDANVIAGKSWTTEINAKQDKLVSGTNIKTINNQSVLGSGNIAISANPTFVCERYSEDISVKGGSLQTVTLTSRSKSGYTPLIIALNGALATDGSSIGIYYNLTSRTLASGQISNIKVQLIVGTTTAKTIRFVTDVLWMKN